MAEVFEETGYGRDTNAGLPLTDARSILPSPAAIREMPFDLSPMRKIDGSFTPLIGKGDRDDRVAECGLPAVRCVIRSSSCAEA
jgi:hypothetical protein